MESMRNKASSDPNLNPVWCPIIGCYISPDASTAAHVVPHSIGCEIAGYIFGEVEKEKDVIWDRRNGIIMHHHLEKKAR